MSIEDIQEIMALLGSFGTGAVVAGLIVFGMLKSFLPSCLFEKGKHQLRMAALDRRSEAHQEAFALCRKLVSSVHHENIGEVVMECQYWWNKNCLYLGPEAREAFNLDHTFSMFWGSTSAMNRKFAIKVGQPVAQLPPHKSLRAELPHRAFQSCSLRTRSHSLRNHDKYVVSLTESL